MNILEKIIIQKQNEVEKLRKTYVPDFFNRTTPLLSFKHNFLQEKSSGIIAEFKRRSPSKPNINETANINETLLAYEAAGVCGVSILTDEKFFGGKATDITENADKLNIPILRKDFIIEDIQIYQSYEMGASAILLIAAAHEPCKIEKLAKIARRLNLEVLLEIHTEDELESINEYITMVGVNNRNLKTMEVTLDTSIRLSKLIPDHFIKISESGIKTQEDIYKLQDAGFRGFLMGEIFMQNENPGKSCSDFINNLRL